METISHWLPVSVHQSAYQVQQGSSTLCVGETTLATSLSAKEIVRFFLSCMAEEFGIAFACSLHGLSKNDLQSVGLFSECSYERHHIEGRSSPLLNVFFLYSWFRIAFSILVYLLFMSL